MESMYVILILIGIYIVYSIISKIIGILSNSRKYLKLKPQLDALEADKVNYNKQIEKDRFEFLTKVTKWEKDVEDTKKAIDNIIKQKSMGFPWLASAFADYKTIADNQAERYLLYKKRPAPSAAEVVKEVKKNKRILIKDKKIAEYKLTYLLTLFPWLSDLIAENEDEDIPVEMFSREDDDSSKEDSVKKYLTDEEYKRLSSVDRNQKALDRYLESRNKSNWAIGRDYEMYVGYLCEQKGYDVEYKGIIDGFEDLGRDIIAKNDHETCIIQCKYWAQYKEIHEKHVFQLFGTTMEYWLKHCTHSKQPRNISEFSLSLDTNKIIPIFTTSTKLSDKAREIASALNIKIKENHPLGDFPRIKCNINSSPNGTETKIYHLPMDQQYDRTKIGNRKGEFYAFTVKQAEDAGFRRAFRHNFNARR